MTPKTEYLSYTGNKRGWSEQRLQLLIENLEVQMWCYRSRYLWTNLAP